MKRIINYNCDGLCVQLYCSKRYTHHTQLAINNMFVELGFMLVLNFLYIQRWVFESNTVPLGQLTH